MATFWEEARLGSRETSIQILIFELGYAWTSNRYGMAIDSVISFELVLPTAKIVTVSASSYPDLFAGLKVRSIAVCHHACPDATSLGRVQ